jgi:hypothetical protein
VWPGLCWRPDDQRGFVTLKSADGGEHLINVNYIIG